MTTTHPTPSQGDERRALSILATFVHETWAGAYSWSELEHKARTALERAGLLSLQDVLALSAALAAPQPSQGANVKVGGSTVYVTNNHRRESNRWWATVYPGFDDDDKRVSVEECDAIARKIADALNVLAAPHPPVSAEAGKGVAGLTLTQDNTKPGKVTYIRQLPHGFLVGVEGHLPYKFKGERADIRLALAPSESVAVSGEVSDVAIDSAISTVWEDWEDDIDRRRELARAVLALAGSAKQAAALERMARLDDEMGIEP